MAPGGAGPEVGHRPRNGAQARSVSPVAGRGGAGSRLLAGV